MHLKQNSALLPAALRSGDTVGVAAPAGAFDHDRFRRGLTAIEKMGFNVFVPDGVFQKTRYLAGTDERRAEEIHDLFRDPDIKAVLCARGGFGSLRLLPLLNFGLIQKNAKIVAGFSDVSVLLNVIFRKTGLVTFHAPVVTSLAEAGPETVKSMKNVLTSGGCQECRSRGPAIQSGTAEGTVCGGNLASLCHLAGTPFQPNGEGRLLLLEDINEPAYRIDRMLTQMRLAGCLDNLAGVMLGCFENCGDERVLYEIIGEHVSPQIPVLAGFVVGHGDENLTLPLGIAATLDADEGVLRYHGPAVAAGSR